MNYLVKTDSGFCFRLRVPPDLQDVVGKIELRYTLGTGSVRRARPIAKALARGLWELFKQLRKGDSKLTDLTNEQIQTLIEKYLRQSINDMEDRYLNADDDLPISDHGSFVSYLSDLDLIKDDLVFYLASGQYDTVVRIADRLLEDSGITMDHDSPGYIRLCRGLLRAQMKEIEIEKRQLITGQVEDLLPVSAMPEEDKTSSLVNKRGPAPDSLTKVIEEYVRENESWTPKTKGGLG
jgi:hypothetical protein